jgi:hypothetical protein
MGATRGNALHGALRQTLGIALSAAVALTLLPEVAAASCGSAYCTLMTDRYAQGAGDAHMGLSLDMHLEAVTQTQLRTGTHNLQASEVTGEAAIERRTRNQTQVTTLAYGFNTDWSVSLRVPVARRNHSHDLIDETTGLPGTPEQWRFTQLGDVQALARRQFVASEGAVAYALFGGFKLPTGSTHITNSDGSRAERALQPGSGTTDLVVGMAGRRAMGLTDVLMGQVSVAQALNDREQFKPGRRIDVSAGWSHAYSPTLGAVLQLNLSRRARDSGAQAEPDNSGSTTVHLSPGFTVGVGHAATLYAYVQVPLYQRVNGIQLVAHSALALGWTSDF